MDQAAAQSMTRHIAQAGSWTKHLDQASDPSCRIQQVVQGWSIYISACVHVGVLVSAPVSTYSFVCFLSARSMCFPSLHVLFYVFMIAMPLTGWALVSSDPIDVPTILFGVIPLPLAAFSLISCG